jgi:hypothetical protein
VVLAIASILCSLGVSQVAHATAATQSVAFPMYEYPTVGTLWSDINTAGPQVPLLIVNPGSGPGASVDPTYTSHIAANISAGQRSIGYVYTSYQARPIADVIGDIDKFYQFYPGISGIFIDLVQNGTANDLCYAATIHNYVKARHPSHLVVMNFGTHVEARYEPYGDMFMNAEDYYNVYTSWTPRTDGFENNPANAARFWHVIHTATAGQLASALNLSRTNNAGWVTITNATMPNPYNATPSYLATFLSGVSSLPQSSIPNRGSSPLPAGCLDLSLAVSGSATNITANVKNTDLSRTAWGSTKVSYTLPAGVTLQSLSGGGGWACTGQTCTHDGPLGANAAAPEVTARIAVDCSYTSGNATVGLQNFANNIETSTVTIAKPSSCGAAVTSPSQSMSGAMPVWTTLTTASTAGDSLQNPFAQTQADINARRVASAFSNPETVSPVAEAFNFTPVGWGLVGVVVLGVGVGVYTIWRRHNASVI